MEKTFDVMIRRFPYLAMKLQLKDLDVSWAMSVARTVLHNLCIKWREEAEEAKRRSIQVMEMKLLRHEGVILFLSHSTKLQMK